MTELSEAFFRTLLRTQFLPASSMQAYQRGLLERLIRHARIQVPFYRDSGRLDPLFASDGSIDWGRWDEIPILTRAVAQANAQALFADSVPEECGPVTSGYTGGSSGTPLALRVNSILASAGSANLERGFVWAGLPDKLSVAWLLNDRKGEMSYPGGGLLRSTMRGSTRLIHQLALATPVERQVEWLARLRPDVVMTYPAVLALLGSALGTSLDGHRFQLAVCVGEVTTDQLRAEITDSFRCPVMDLYSGSEFGPIAVEDIGLRRFLVCEESVFLESQPCLEFTASDGELVELVFTPFYNYAMPLIRYATGDYAIVDDDPISDPRTLRRLKRIAGRERNLFILPSGRRWCPTYQNKIMCEYIDYKQIQFAQTARDRIEIRFVSDQPAPIKDADRLLGYLRSATPEPMDVGVTRVTEIARRPSGKYEYAACEIDRPLDALKR
jgi:phenylacetate-CoA ligase